MNHSLIEQWHAMIENNEPNRLEQLIDDHCVFYSPVVFRAQEGKRLTVVYLTAAFKMFNEAESFDYVKQIVGENEAMLEFTSRIEGIVINGVDIITWNEQGKITEFKVMVRSLQAIDIIKEKMMSYLSNMSTYKKLKLAGGVFWDKFKF